MPLTKGQILQERYRIENLLAEGATGAVYRAFDETLGMPVAIKEKLGTSSEAQEEFSREAGILHKLRHPNLSRVTDSFAIPGQGQYLVMDHVEGEDLDQVLADQKVVSESQALEWIGQVLEALEYLHRQNVVHRDVKPANIKITSKGEVYLVDLGLAWAKERQQETSTEEDVSPSGFAPPEQYGPGSIDARSDVYSAGATLYALLTGQTPPDALELVAGQAQLPPPRQLNPKVSAQVEKAILQAMELAAADRFQTAAEFRAALPEPQPGQEPSADGAVRPRPASMLGSRRAGLWIVGALLVALALILVVWQPMAPKTTPPETDVAPTAQLSAGDHFQRGNELIQAGELEGAASEYQQALELDPEYVDALANLGVVYYNLGQLDQAAEQYLKAIEVAPDDADIRSNLAAAYVQMGQLDSALEQYLKAVELSPDLAEAHFGLGVIYVQLGEKDEAIQAFERFQELDTGRDTMASSQAEQYLEQLKGQ
jgi:tetratricopeptide (TPR) repeat protein